MTDTKKIKFDHCKNAEYVENAIELFGADVIILEDQLYKHLDRLLEEYNGGCFTWNVTDEYAVLITDDEDQHRLVTANYIDEVVSLKVASVLANLMILNALTWQSYEMQQHERQERFTTAYYAFRRDVFDGLEGHLTDEEVSIIAKAID